MYTVEDINKAKQYLSEQGYGTGSNFALNTVANLMAEWAAKHCSIPAVMRCGYCLFAQGGDEFKFRNGETNYRYECTLRSRNGNIVFLDSESEHYRWHNQKACENFEGAGKSLNKRADLDNTKFDFLSDGHFEVLP